MSSTRHLIATALGSALLVFGCDKGSENPKPTAAAAQPAAPAAPATPVAAAEPAKPNPAAEAKKYFQTTCVVCHGDHGAGDGPGAAALDPKPRAFSDPAWQAGITDEAMRKVILEGGAAVGKSAGMAPNPKLKDKPEVLEELVKIVRGFKK